MKNKDNPENMAERLKEYYTIGCCGIDCGLCPRFHTRGDSVCPGCGGPGFRDKHPSCGYLSCCTVRKGLEVCSECSDFPCVKFVPERISFDSFVTGKKMLPNLEYIKNNGMELFLEQHNARIAFLKYLLNSFDDGRSKSFFCIACALLPSDKLKLACREFESLEHLDIREKNKKVRNRLMSIAEDAGVELKLRTRVK